MFKKLKDRNINLEIHDNIYNVNNWAIFKKNFLAGFARGLGSWVFNIIFLALLAYISIPFFDSAKRLIDHLSKDLENNSVQIKEKSN